jgi:putative heme-binding domain-containing protein
VELEAQPANAWGHRALAETKPTAALTALLALARVGEPTWQHQVLERLIEWDAPKLTPEQQLIAIRAAGVCGLRMGRPDAEMAKRLGVVWERHYPSSDARVSQSLCELLVYLESPGVVRKTLPLLASADMQEEKLHYLFTLRLVKAGWSVDERRTYLEWLGRARKEFYGANSLPTTLNYIRAEVEASLSPAERSALVAELAALNRPANTVPAPVTRSFVKSWSMADFASAPAALKAGRDLSRGKRLFAETGCAQCHRVGAEGGVAGPDLTAVGARFDARALLESIIEPSKVVADTYRSVAITTKAGLIHEGRVISEDDRNVILATNPIDSDDRRRIAKSQIASQRVSEVSSMPEGLLNTLQRDEVLDLLAWLSAGVTR